MRFSSRNMFGALLMRFSSRNMFGFRFQDGVREFPEKNRVHLARILSEMVKKGMLCKITRGHYHIIPMNADPETYAPVGHQVAKYLMQNKEYYIGYASAMKTHGLIPQAEAGKPDRLPDRVYVVTKKQMKPAIRSFGRIGKKNEEIWIEN